MDSLRAQEPAGIAEIIIVDDGERGVAGELGSSDEAGAALERSGGRGPAAARNVGIRRARGEIVALTDDDCEVAADWAARLVEALETTGYAAVGGRVEAAVGTLLAGRVSQSITNGFVGSMNEDASDARFLTSNNVAYRKRALLDAGLFDEAFRTAGGEERELHARLRARGRRLGFAADIVVQHHLDLDWAGFVRQQVRYGRGARLLRRCARSAGTTPSGLPAHAYLRAFRSAIRQAAPADRVAVATGFALAQALVAWGFLLGPADFGASSGTRCR